MAVNLFVTPTVLLAFPDFVASGTERSDVVIHDAQLKTNAGLDGLRAKTQRPAGAQCCLARTPFFWESFWYSRKIMEMYRSTAWNHICGDIMIYPIISGAHRTRSDIMKLRLVSLYISSFCHTCSLVHPDTHETKHNLWSYPVA